VINAIAVFLEDIEDDSWKATRDQMHAYWRNDTISQELDQSFLAVFYIGMQKSLGMSDLQMEAFIKRFGRFWFEPKPPANTDIYFLHFLLGPGIREALQHSGTSTYIPDGCRAFVDAFVAKSQVILDFRTEGDQLIIEIPQCSFCNHDPHCRLFHGIFEGLLVWLSEQAPPDTPVYQVDETASTAHRVVLRPQVPSGELKSI
jgi:hypothetical protein